MARGEAPEYMSIDWDKFCQVVIERWQRMLLKKDIFDTGTLYRSFEYNYRAVNAANQVVGRGSGAAHGGVKVPDWVAFSFPMYGIYVEKGVGRGYTRGNTGLVKFESRGRGRERRTWYYRIFANQRHRLGELVAEAYGRAAASMIHTLEVKTIGRKPTT